MNPNPVRVRLNLNADDYAQLKFQYYFDWANGFATNERELQSILANKSMYSFFEAQFSKFEAEFLELMHEYTDQAQIKPADVFKTYKMTCDQIYRFYSPVLIANAKQNKILN